MRQDPYPSQKGNRSKLKKRLLVFCLDIMMRLYRYDITFIYVKESDLIIADALSRDVESDKETRLRIFNVKTFEEFPDDRVTEVREVTQKSQELQNMIKLYKMDGLRKW